MPLVTGTASESGRRARWPYVAVAAVLVASWLEARVVGVPFETLGLNDFWQFLDPVVLRDDLLRAVLSLHMQPPLFNAFIGIALKLFGPAAGFPLSLAYLVMGTLLVLTMLWVMRHLGASDVVAVAVCALFALHPAFILYERWLFYPVPNALLLILTTAALVRFLETGRARWAGAFAGAATLLMLARQVFHLLWFVGSVVTVAAMIQRTERRRLLVASLAPLLIVNLLYLKNWLLVGEYGASTWTGMALHLGMDVPEEFTLDEVMPMIRDGRVPPVWLAGVFPTPERVEPFGYFPPNEGTNPALDARYRSTGFPNYNNREYARISHDMLWGALALIRAYPGRYLARVRLGVYEFFQPGPRRLFGWHRVEEPRLRPWIEAWNRRLFLSGLLGGSGLDVPNLLMLIYPTCVLFALARAWSRSPHRAAFAFVAITLLWVFVLTNLLVLDENDRVRFETDPLLAVLVATGLSAALRRFARARTPPMPTARTA
jgi:hypothetical protein